LTDGGDPPLPDGIDAGIKPSCTLAIQTRAAIVSLQLKKAKKRDGILRHRPFFYFEPA
jgi:hypothetical protein